MYQRKVDVDMLNTVKSVRALALCQCKEAILWVRREFMINGLYGVRAHDADQN